MQTLNTYLYILNLYAYIYVYVGSTCAGYIEIIIIIIIASLDDERAVDAKSDGSTAEYDKFHSIHNLWLFFTYLWGSSLIERET